MKNPSDNASVRPARPTTVLVVCLCMVVATMAVFAEGFRNPPDGAALGHVGGKIVFSDDASAIAHNPANLVDLEGPEAQATLTLLHSKAEYESAAGTSAETEEPWKWLPNLYFAWPLQDGQFAAGVGVTTPFGQSTEWSKTSVFQYTAPYFAELRVVNVNPTLAARLGDRLAVAVGGDLYWSDLDLKQVYSWYNVTKSLADRDGEASFCGDGQGLGGNVAVALEVTDRQRLAVTYRSAVKVEYEGDFEISNIPAAAKVSPLLQALTSRSDFDTEIEFPAVAALGYGVKATDTLRFEVDVEWIEFSRYDALDLDIGNNSLLLPSRTITQDWEDSWTFGVGADWNLRPELVLRAGYIFIESPIPDKTLAPTLPDADRHVVSVGLGYEKGGHALELACAFSFFDERDIEGNQNPAYDGEYELTSSLFGLSYGYTF